MGATRVNVHICSIQVYRLNIEKIEELYKVKTSSEVKKNVH